MRIAHLDGDPYLWLTLPPTEPLCAVCDEPIMWILDAFTFVRPATRGAPRLAHLRCVWTQEAIIRESKRAASHGEISGITGA